MVNRGEGTFKYRISVVDGKKHGNLGPKTTAAQEQSREIIIPATVKREPVPVAARSKA